MLTRLLLVPIAFTLAAQTIDFEGRAAVILKNDRLQLTVLTQGATMANLLMNDDPSKLSPYWDTEHALHPTGPVTARPGGSLGHFLCLDGFGTPSDEERAAGMPGHGEANRQMFEVAAPAKQDGISTLNLTAKLPLAQESVIRNIRMVDGESVVYVNTEVESALSIDRPVSWAEHATMGPPFLTPGDTQIDLPGKNCRVRPQKAGSTGKLDYGKDFLWPNAPLTKGGTLNLIPVSEGPAALDLATCQIDPARTYGYVAALRPSKHILFGYVFRREQFPWLMAWMNYTGDARAARGIEFSTQPFDISHREAVDMHDMFGTPSYKWLPAKAKLHASYAFFYTKVPDNYQGTVDVKVENGHIILVDKAGHTVTLAARLPL